MRLCRWQQKVLHESNTCNLYVYLSVPIYISIHWSTNINSLYIYNGYIILIMYLFHIVYIYMYTVTNEYKALW